MQEGYTSPQNSRKTKSEIYSCMKFHGTNLKCSHSESIESHPNKSIKIPLAKEKIHSSIFLRSRGEKSEIHEKDIQNFLKKIHTEVDGTFLQEDQSQIIQNVHLADIQHGTSKDSIIEEKSQMETDNINSQQNKLKNIVFEALSQITTLSQLKQLIQLFNPSIRQQIEYIEAQNRKLEKENKTLRQNNDMVKRQKNKLSIKYKILQNEARIFQQNNQEISKNYVELIDELSHLKNEESGDLIGHSSLHQSLQGIIKNYQPFSKNQNSKQQISFKATKFEQEEKGIKIFESEYLTAAERQTTKNNYLL